jgi:hypothetical protein
METEMFDKPPGKQLGKFRKEKCEFSLIKRDGNIALFSRTDPHGMRYEVIKIRTHKKDRIIAGKVVNKEGDEYYPCTEEFGRFGWYCITREEAEKRYTSLIKAREKGE